MQAVWEEAEGGWRGYRGVRARDVRLKWYGPAEGALVHTGGKCASIVAVGSSGVAGGRLLRGRQSEKFLALSPE